MENKKVKIVLSIIFILIVVAVIVLINIYNEEIAAKAKEIQEIITQTGYKSNDEIQIVPTMQDEISDNAIWCATFQLVWNDLKNDVAKTDIVFNETVTEAENLNKEEFNVTMISDDYYYKKCGIMNENLKKEIENGVKDKFGETATILNDFDWTDEGDKKYFLYAMLKREFEFYTEFDNLEKGTFANKYENVNYFGIDDETDNSAREQVEVMYYNSKDDFAILINTKQNDQVIIVKGNEGKTFKDIYDKVKNSTYIGSRSLQENEYLKIPNVKLKEKKEYEKLEDKEFALSNGELLEIAKAVQTVEFELDKNGGKVKSEAAMEINRASLPVEQTETREFNIDNTFTIFLKENGKDMPYFAAKISDITKFQ